MKLDFSTTKQELVSNGIGISSYHKRHSNLAFLREFIQSGKDAARVVFEDGDNPVNVVACLRTCVRRHEFPVVVSRRKGCVYLMREEA